MSWLAKTVARFRGLRKRSVFISHASKDEELISAFVDLIEGIGLDSSTQIFYTSRIRQGVQPGDDFNNRIQQRIRDAEFGLAIITPNFLENQYCLWELGYHCGVNKKLYPILVPPMVYSDIPDMIAGIEAVNIDRDDELDSLARVIAHRLRDGEPDWPKWNERKKSFLANFSSSPPGPNEPLTIVFYAPSLRPHSFIAEIIDSAVDSAKKRQFTFVLEAGTGLHTSTEHIDVLLRYSKSKNTVILMIPPNPESYTNIWQIFEAASKKNGGWNNVASLITLDIPPDLNSEKDRNAFRKCEAHKGVILVDSDKGAKMAAEEIVGFCKDESLQSITVIICEGNLHGQPLNERGKKFNDAINSMASQYSLGLENLWDGKALDFDNAFDAAYRYVKTILSNKNISHDNVFVFCANDNLALGASCALSHHVRNTNDQRKFRIICFDRTHLIGKYIRLEHGFFWRAVDQQTQIMANKAMSTALSLFSDAPLLPPEKVIKSPPII